MLYELLYTSAAETLDGGSGYGIVVRTRGFPARLEKFVRQICFYDFLSPADSSAQTNDPPVFSHLIWEEAGARWHIFSRVGPGGRDYTHRTVFLAHHVAVPDHVFHSGSPARLMREPTLFRTSWDGSPGEIEARELPKCPASPASPSTWASLAGDPLWSQTWVDRWRRQAGASQFLIVPTQADVLSLFAEAMTFVPDKEARELTFYTLLASDRAPARLDWVGVPAGAATANQIVSKSADRVIDLSRPLGPAPKPAPARQVSVPARSAAVERDEFADFMEPVPARRKAVTAATHATKGNSSSMMPAAKPARLPAPPPPPAPRSRLPVLSIAAALCLACVAMITVGYRQFGSHAPEASKGDATKQLAASGEPSRDSKPPQNKQEIRQAVHEQPVAALPERKFRPQFVCAIDFRSAVAAGSLSVESSGITSGATLAWIAASGHELQHNTGNPLKFIAGGHKGELIVRFVNSQLTFDWKVTDQRANKLDIEKDKEDCLRQFWPSILDIVPKNPGEQGTRIVFFPEEQLWQDVPPKINQLREFLHRFGRVFKTSASQVVPK